MSEKTKSIAKGISVLGLTGIICKFIGVLYSIPLAGILGDTGLGMFQTVFPTYNLLLTLSSAGIPVAVSRMVSHCLAKNQPRNAKQVFIIALKLLSSIGVFFSLLMIISNQLLTGLVSCSDASIGFYAIAPCVAIVCVLSAFRGYIQGHQNMVPTAISQLIEQVGKVVISLPLAAVGMHYSVAYGAAGALLGISIVQGLALLYMILRYFLKEKKEHLSFSNSEDSISNRQIYRRMITISIPITISACIIPLAQFIDSTLMIKRMVISGLSQTSATALYGIFSGMVIRLINIPTALALAISMSLVPAISSVRAVNDVAGIRRESYHGIRYAFLIGFPCAIGMSLLSKEILSFFYDRTLSSERLNIAASLLSKSALTIVLFTVVQATSSILQGLQKQKIPMYTMIAGVLIKVVLNYLLIAIPEINIHGGPIASIACYSTVMIPNLWFCCKYTGMSFNLKNWILLPGVCVLLMGVAVYIMQLVLPAGRITTILKVLVGFTVYIMCAIRFHALTKQDLQSLRRKK